MTEIQANPTIGERGVVSVRLPAGAGPHPVVVGIHGGGWQNGDRCSYDWCWERLRPLGVALVLCSHRPASTARFPGAYRDVVHVLRWLHDRGAEHGLDRGRCALFGCSSGGHLVSLLATRATDEERGIASIRAAISYAGVMDMTAWHHELMRLIPGSTTAADFMGADPTEDPDAWRAASPLPHVHARVPPMLLIHGTEDAVVPVTQSRVMFAALRRAGHAPELLEVSDGHFAMNAACPGERKEFIREAEVLRFLRAHL